MTITSRIRRAPYALGFAAAIGVSAAAAAEPPAASSDTAAAVIDTSDWKCTQCPFLHGSSGEAVLGALYADGANASYGRYTGLNHGGVYADAGVSGQLRTNDGSFADYDLERLGLASRQGYVDGGREGRYDLRVSYDGQPSRRYDTAVTPFRASRDDLLLPADWVPAGTTSGMTALAKSLAPVDVGYDRRTVALLGRFFVSADWTIFGEFRRQEKIGSDLTSASFLTQAVQLVQPVDYVTNSFEAGAAWSGRRSSFRLSYTGSWFTDKSDALNFDDPYLAIVPGSITGRIGVPPGNTLHQIAATGNLQLPWFGTVLNYAATLGRLRQNDGFLPISTSPSALATMPESLDGNVHLSHYAFGLAARPWPKLSVRGNAAYDGRDDRTSPFAVTYVVTDTFPAGAVVTPRYSEDRVRLDGGADYSWANWIRIGVGGKFLDNDYGPGQVVTNTQETQSWGRATIIPVAPLRLTLKIGNSLRKASSFNAGALPVDENPLIRAYDYAPRDRVFSAVTGAWTATPALTLTVEGFLAKDDYRSSPLGLQSAHERRASTTLAWTPRETLSAYIDAGYQRLFNLQAGNTGLAVAPWSATDTERFWNAGVGGRWVPRERLTITLDYLLAPSYGDIDTVAGTLSQAFPQNTAKLETTRLQASYQWTASMEIDFRYTRETYRSSDWALAGLGPSTVPNLLALGIAPYRDNVNLFGLAIHYQFGRDNSGAHESP